jgi:eukaryotic-like serine/threonine-protein kinase
MADTKANQACPSLDQYRQLTSGKLAENDKELLLIHLESCDACALRMRTLPEQDTLVGMLRQSDTLGDASSGKVVAELVERLSKLRPVDASGGTVAPRPEVAMTQSQNTVDHQPAEAARNATYDFLAAPQQPDELGRLGDYRVLGVLGTGGMGVVFRAEDSQLARQVALKAMLPGFVASEGARQRFVREARAAAGIKHDHIVSIYQVGEDHGVLFLAMELLEGESLESRLQRDGKLPASEVVRIGRQIAAALGAAHKRGLIHRDIKPANTWLEAETDRVKILDFGLARGTADSAQLTQQGAIVGTPAYMAPEQAKGQTVDHRCDLFSLGCVLYRMATGKQPFHGTDVVSTLVSVATETPRPPHMLEPTLPRALCNLIVNLLEKEPASRPESARGVADRLDRIAEELARPVPVKKRRAWWPVVAGAGALLALIAASVVFFMQTTDGVVRIEIDDPEIKLAIEGHSATITKADTQPITLKPGKHGLTITRGDFTFDTTTFELARKGKATLKVSWHAGQKMVVMQDGQVIGEKVAPPAPAVVAPRPASNRFKNILGMEFALVPKGKAWLGGGGGKPGDKEVEFKNDFYLGVYEVTQEEWEKAMGVNPSWFSRFGAGKDAVKDIPDAELKRFPVENVSWDECQVFLAKLNAKATDTGWTYRLASETEWEYACRGGPMTHLGESAFSFYLAKPALQLLPEQANNKDSGLNRPRRVGSYEPNGLGLFDMHGNVHELCLDEDAAAKAKGVLMRVFRGGSWSDLKDVRGGWRFKTDARQSGVGLRVARVRVAPMPQPAFAAAPFGEKQAKAHQEEWAKHLGRKVVQANSLDMKMTLIPPGKFLMGANEVEKDGTVEFKVKSAQDEKPQRLVELPTPFVIGTTEVTQEQFEKLMGRNPSNYGAQGRAADKVKGIDSRSLPVESVSWFDAVEFCNKLSTKEGLAPYYDLKNPLRQKDGSISEADVKELGGVGYRLPTEAEWEYACRAGTATPFSFEFNYGTLPQYGWFGYDSKRPRAVGERKPNAFGLFDMHGNVFEWCSDWFGPYAASSTRDPRGPAGGTERVMRGGCWNYLPPYCRSASRNKLGPRGRLDNIGFRVVHSVTTAPAADPDRRAAEWVLSVGGGLTINSAGRDRSINNAEELPPGAFQLSGAGWAKENGLVDDAGLAHFRDCKNLTSIVLVAKQVTDAGMVNFEHCKKLSKLWLIRTGVTDAGLAHFKDCKNLTDVHLGNTVVTDAGLAMFKDLKDLTKLQLSSTKVTDVGLAHLKDLRLQTLTLDQTEVSDAKLPQLNGLTTLRLLRLQSTKVTAAGVKKLAAALPQCKIEWDGGVIAPTAGADPDRRAAEWVLSLGGHVHTVPYKSEPTILELQNLPDTPFELRSVMLGNNLNMTDEGLANLRGCKHLAWLDLAGTQLTDTGLAHISGLEGLRELGVARTKVTDDGLIHLKNLAKLRLLSFEDTAVTGAGLVHVKGNKNLNHLNLTGTHLSDAAFDHLKEMISLGELSLINTRTNNADLAMLAKLTNLWNLQLGFTKVSAGGLVHLKDCKNLVHLGLAETRITNADLAHVSEFKNLVWLELNNASISDEGLAHLKGLVKMEAMNLTGTSISRAGLLHLKDFKSLIGITLSKTKIGDESIDAMANWSKLKHIRLQETKVTDAGAKQLASKLPGCKVEWDGGVITVNASAPDAARRAAAVWVLLDRGPACRSYLTITKDGKDLRLTTGDTIPESPFTVRQISISGIAKEDSRLAIEHLMSIATVDLRIYHSPGIGDDELATLAGHPSYQKLQTLILNTVGLTEKGLASIARFPDLKVLTLGLTSVSAKELALYRKQPLEQVTLFLSKTVNDDAIAELKNFSKLKRLELAAVPITPRALEHLAKCASLETLIFRRITVPEDARKKLAEALPKCSIRWESAD